MSQQEEKGLIFLRAYYWGELSYKKKNETKEEEATMLPTGH